MSRKKRSVRLGDLKEGPQRHELLPPDLVDRIKAIQAWRQPYSACSLADTLRDFRHDAHPEREVQIWECIGAGMERVSGLPFHQRDAIFKALLGWSIRVDPGQPGGPAETLVDAEVPIEVWRDADAACIAKHDEFTWQTDDEIEREMRDAAQDIHKPEWWERS